MEIIDAMKAHPVIVATGIGVVSLLLLSNRGGGSGIDPVAASLQSQSIASSTNVALGEYTAKLAAINTQAAKESYVASLNASLAGEVNQNETLVDLLSTFYFHDIANKEVEAKRALAAKELTYAHSEELRKIRLQGRTLKFEHLDLPMILANKLSLARVEAESNQAIAEINAYAANTAADAAAHSSKTKDDQSWIDKGIDIVSSIGGLF